MHDIWTAEGRREAMAVNIVPVYSTADIEWTADLLSERPSIDWWERGAPKR